MIDLAIIILKFVIFGQHYSIEVSSQWSLVWSKKSKPISAADSKNVTVGDKVIGAHVS